MMKRKIMPVFMAVLLTACSAGNETKADVHENAQPVELMYATQFTASVTPEGAYIISIGEDDFLVVPENADISGYEGMTVIEQSADNIYLAASSAMDLVDSLGALDSILATSTAAKDWSLPEIKEAVEDDDIFYVGKYSAPDYEFLVSEGCSYAVESTMIYHKPEVKEQLEALGIPVLVERSSYEQHPLGRLEWIKLYGILMGKEDEAEKIFNEKLSLAESISGEDTGLTAAFFYIGSNGYVNVRKPGDYISEMIRLAGGRYLFTADDLKVDENALSTMNMQFEAFYAAAKDADVLIYNSTIDGGVASIDALIEKDGLFADFKAVQNGNVWITGQNMFQQTSCTAEVIKDMNRIFTGTAEDDMDYLKRLD